MTFHLPLPARRRMCARLVVAMAATSWAASGWAQAPAAGRTEALYEGVLGTSLIGMTLVAPKGAEGRLAGHYFYGKFLKDIPLTGSFQGGRLTLREAGGGTFTLELVGNGTGGGKPLDFSNSIGLAGAWTQGGKRLDVTLGNTANRPAGGRRYEQVTKETDEEFEARVQGFHRAVLAGRPRRGGTLHRLSVARQPGRQGPRDRIGRAARRRLGPGLYAGLPQRAEGGAAA